MTGDQRRQQLIDVAREVFGARGYGPTSIEEIAARAGVSKPVVYEHFGGKEGIYAVVNFTATSEATQELDRQLKLNESVLRTKVLRQAK